MVKIRLARFGSKNNSYYRIIVTDSRSKRDGKFIEILGGYNPQSVSKNVKINKERYDFWILHGAQPSDTVRKLIAK